jgi:hypothetical protein
MYHSNLKWQFGPVNLRSQRFAGSSACVTTRSSSNAHEEDCPRKRYFLYLPFHGSKRMCSSNWKLTAAVRCR